MKRLAFVFLVLLLVISRAKAEDESDCLDIQGINDMVKEDKTLEFPRRVIKPYVDRAIAFFYSQTVQKNSKYWTDVILIDKSNGGGLIIVGDGPDDFCQWLAITPEAWPIVEKQLEGTRV